MHLLPVAESVVCFVVFVFLRFFLWFVASVICLSCWKGSEVDAHQILGIHSMRILMSFYILLSRFYKLQSVFSNQTTNLPAQSWRSQIVPDHLCLDETELIQAPQPNKYDKSCRSFQDGVGPCNQRFGSHNVCHDLSFDLSIVLSSICHSRDLMLEIHR